MVATTPLLVSVMMFVISVVELGTVCKTCAGIYGASTLLAIGALLHLATLRRAPEVLGLAPRPRGALALTVPWLLVLGVVTLVPSLVYAASAPDQRPYLTQCGQIKTPNDPKAGLIPLRSPQAIQPVLLFEDPLCATCKAFHQRLRSEGILPRLDVHLVLFPLDIFSSFC